MTAFATSPSGLLVPVPKPDPHALQPGQPWHSAWLRDDGWWESGDRCTVCPGCGLCKEVMRRTEAGMLEYRCLGCETIY